MKTENLKEGQVYYVADYFVDEDTNIRHYFIRSFMWDCRKLTHRIFVEKKEEFVFANQKTAENLCELLNNNQ